MSDFQFLPPAGSEQTGAYQTVLGQPSVDGPIIYPETQPDTNPNVVPLTRETGLDPAKIPTLNEILNQKPVLRVVEGGRTAPVAPVPAEATGAVQQGALVVAAQSGRTPVGTLPTRLGQTPEQPATTITVKPQAEPQPKQGFSMPWWGTLLLAGAAVAVGYSLAKRGNDEPLVADMDDEEAED
jgi:hypothetical protein